MNYNPKIHHRRSIRLREYDYNQAGAYFITFCIDDRKCLFGKIEEGLMLKNDFGDIVEKEWLKTAQIRTNVELDQHVVMPNHFHGIIVIIDDTNVGATRWVAQNENIKRASHRLAPTLQGPKSHSLGAIIAQLKSNITKIIRKAGLPHFKWQRNYYEHVIRNEDDLNQIREYIFNNPLKWEFDHNNPNFIPVA